MSSLQYVAGLKVMGKDMTIARNDVGSFVDVGDLLGFEAGC